MIQSLEVRLKSIGNQKQNISQTQSYEIEDLQNALKACMLRERQLIQENAQKDEQIHIITDSSKQQLKLLMQQMNERQNVNTDTNMNSNSSTNLKPPSMPPPPICGISSIEKLEEENKRLQLDIKRVLNKLSMRENEHQQMHEKIAEQKRTIDRLSTVEKEKRLLMDRLETANARCESMENHRKQFIETAAIAEKIQQELKNMKQKLSIVVQEKENLKDETLHKSSMIADLKQSLSSSKLSLNNSESIEQELRLKLDSISANAREELEKYKSELQNMEIVMDDVQNQLSLKTKENERQMKEIAMKTENYDQRVQHLMEEKKILKEREEERIVCHAQELNAFQLDFEIKERKKKKLVRELQVQLKQEVMKSQEWRMKTLKMEDEINDLKQRQKLYAKILKKKAQQNMSNINQNNIHSNSPSKDNEIENGNEVENDYMHSRSYSHSTSISVEKEISIAMSKKVIDSEEELLSLRAQTKYLQDTVQQMHIEMGNKKTIIVNLIKRMDIGGLTAHKYSQSSSNDMHSNLNINSHQTQNSDIRTVMKQMQLIVEETTLQNSMLKSDLRTMATEIERLSKNNTSD